MGEEQERPHETGETYFSRQIGAQVTRKLKAKGNAGRHVWFGFGMFGLIGWSVAIPTLLGALLGIWLDSRYPGQTHSWTLSLLIVGLFTGCGSAAHWVAKESKEMLEEEERNE